MFVFELHLVRQIKALNFDQLSTHWLLQAFHQAQRPGQKYFQTHYIKMHRRAQQEVIPVSSSQTFQFLHHCQKLQLDSVHHASSCKFIMTICSPNFCRCAQRQFFKSVNWSLVSLDGLILWKDMVSVSGLCYTVVSCLC